MKNPFLCLIAIGLASCAAPKAVVINEAPVKPAVKDVASVPEAPVNKSPGGGMRLPGNMLNLPGEEQLRPSIAPSGESSSPVIVRPPKE